MQLIYLPLAEGSWNVRASKRNRRHTKICDPDFTNRRQKNIDSAPWTDRPSLSADIVTERAAEGRPVYFDGLSIDAIVPGMSMCRSFHFFQCDDRSSASCTALTSGHLLVHSAANEHRSENLREVRQQVKTKICSPDFFGTMNRVLPEL
jgi:hypothetical protein